MKAENLRSEFPVWSVSGESSCWLADDLLSLCAYTAFPDVHRREHDSHSPLLKWPLILLD